MGPGESEAHSDAITVLDQVVDRQPQVGCGGGEHGEEVLNALLALDADERRRAGLTDTARQQKRKMREREFDQLVQLARRPR